MPSAQAPEPTTDFGAGAPIHGFVAAGFEPVANQFARNFSELGDVGAAFSVVRHGETVVACGAVPPRPAVPGPSTRCS